VAGRRYPKNRGDALGKCVRRVGQFFDLSVESSHIPYVNAMLASRLFPPFDGETERLEAAFPKQPRRTMNKIVAAASRLYKEFDQRCSILLQGFERRYPPKSVPHVREPLLTSPI
jgi:hypothetical protein